MECGGGDDGGSGGGGGVGGRSRGLKIEMLHSYVCTKTQSLHHFYWILDLSHHGWGNINTITALKS
jgi:hypothetical protein